MDWGRTVRPRLFKAQAPSLTVFYSTVQELATNICEAFGLAKLSPYMVLRLQRKHTDWNIFLMMGRRISVLIHFRPRVYEYGRGHGSLQESLTAEPLGRRILSLLIEIISDSMRLLQFFDTDREGK